MKLGLRVNGLPKFLLQLRDMENWTDFQIKREIIKFICNLSNFLEHLVWPIKSWAELQNSPHGD